MRNLVVEVSDDDHFSGRGDEDIIIVEYGDFEDPVSGELYWELKRHQYNGAGRVAVVFRHFPIATLHPNAQAAAEAAEAASAQGAFWDMHDVLFENQDDLEPAALFAYADQLELDLVRFTNEIDDHRYLPRIERDLLGGARSGIVKTPALFVNGAPVARHSLEQTLRALLSEDRLTVG